MLLAEWLRDSDARRTIPYIYCYPSCVYEYTILRSPKDDANSSSDEAYDDAHSMIVMRVGIECDVQEEKYSTKHQNHKHRDI